MMRLVAVVAAAAAAASSRVLVATVQNNREMALFGSESKTSPSLNIHPVLALAAQMERGQSILSE